MTVRQQVAAWVGALALVAALLLMPRSWYLPERPLPRADIVVVGSSLMAFGVPPKGGGGSSLLGDGRSHVRLARISITERQLLTLLEKALAARPALVLLEVNPLVVDFADRTRMRPCDGAGWAALAFLQERQLRALDVYQRIRHRPEWNTFPREPMHRFITSRIDPTTIRLTYPLTIRDPCELPRLEALTARAKAQHTALVLVLPPRSPYGSAHIGKRVEGELVAAAERLATHLDVPLFRPEGEWRNAEFTDHAHLNDAGRRHFLADLRQWWAARA